MLTVAQELLLTLAQRRGKNVSIHLFGQEINPETYAIAKADGSPVFSGFLIVFFIETANKLFKNSAHAVVVQTGVFNDGLVRSTP